MKQFDARKYISKSYKCTVCKRVFSSRRKTTQHLHKSRNDTIHRKVITR